MHKEDTKNGNRRTVLDRRPETECLFLCSPQNLQTGCNGATSYALKDFAVSYYVRTPSSVHAHLLKQVHCLGGKVEHGRAMMTKAHYRSNKLRSAKECVQAMLVILGIEYVLLPIDSR